MTADEYYRLGDRAFAAEKFDEASQLFKSALAVDQDHSNSLYRLGEIALRRQNVGEAEAFYRRALAAQPNHVSAKRRLEQLEKKSRPSAATPPRRGMTGLIVFAVVAVLIFFVWMQNSKESEDEQEKIKQMQCDVAKKQGTRLPGC